MTQTLQTQATAVRVTLDDVRTVLDGTDPNQTNASKVRALLGNRGSFETIQKHLGILRAELAAAAAPPVAADAVPALPADAAQAMWVAAWTAAQVQTMARAEKLASERDAALLKLETMGQDLAGFVATVDEQSSKLDQAAATIATVQAAHIADLERLQAEAGAAAADRAQLTQELEKSLLEAQQEAVQAVQALELAKARHALELATLRGELDRQISVMADLRAALQVRPAAAADPTPGDRHPE
jgi:hypothetical protein